MHAHTLPHDVKKHSMLKLKPLPVLKLLCIRLFIFQLITTQSSRTSIVSALFDANADLRTRPYLFHSRVYYILHSFQSFISLSLSLFRRRKYLHTPSPYVMNHNVDFKWAQLARQALACRAA